jgi:Protoporphyrinogen oxidase
LPPTTRDGDVSVAGYVGARLGAEVVDRLVDPLLGGVYAGRSAELSFDATLPALAAASRRHASLAEAAGPCCRPRPGFRGHPRGRTGIHHAHRRPRHAPRLPGQSIGRRGAHRRDSP